MRIVNSLSALLEKRSVEQCNYENCERSLQAIGMLTNRAGGVETALR